MQQTNIETLACLEKVLSQTKQGARRVQRGMLVNSVKPRPALIWGGSRVRFQIYWGISIFGVAASLFAAAIWFNLRGQHLPGRAFNLFLVLVVIVGWPIYAYSARKQEVRRRKPIGNDAFAVEACRMLPSVSKEFALAARHALAAAYCIPTELIAILDTRRRCNSLSLMSEPLAAEVIAHLSRAENIGLDYGTILLISEEFRWRRASTVAELIDLLHRDIRLHPEPLRAQQTAPPSSL